MKKELILEIIQERWSPYSFSSNDVEEFILKAMFEAAGYAPSCNNEQPWMFIYSTQKNRQIFNDYLVSFFLTLALVGLLNFWFLNNPCLTPLMNFAQAKGLRRLLIGY